MTSRLWTDKAENELRHFWRIGWTAGQIEKYFEGGFSRNAIIGKARRLGLEKRTSPIPKKQKPVGVKLVDLGPRSCRWPLGDPRDKDFCFCGRATQGNVYCEAHTNIAYRKHQTKENGNEE